MLEVATLRHTSSHDVTRLHTTSHVITLRHTSSYYVTSFHGVTRRRYPPRPFPQSYISHILLCLLWPAMNKLYYTIFASDPIYLLIQFCPFEDEHEFEIYHNWGNLLYKEGKCYKPRGNFLGCFHAAGLTFTWFALGRWAPCARHPRQKL